MNEERQNKEPANPGLAETATTERPTRRRNSSSESKTRSRWKPSLFGYRWFVRNIGFFLFLATLAVVYIYNGHYADNISRDITRTGKEVKELQYEYKTLKSEVMFRSKQSELARAVAPFGLKQLAQPPYILADSTQTTINTQTTNSTPTTPGTQ